MNIYVGNLAYEVTSTELREAFEAFGTVEDAEVIIDRRRNRSRGYGFVVMPNDEQARKAIETLDGSEFRGREMRVDESQPRKRDNGKGEATRGSRGRRQRAGGQPRQGSHAERAAKPESTGGIVGLIKRLFGGR